MLRIVFEFKDEYTHGEWQRRECTVPSLEYCVKVYGLDTCQYRIVSVETIDE